MEKKPHLCFFFRPWFRFLYTEEIILVIVQREEEQERGYESPIQIKS